MNNSMVTIVVLVVIVIVIVIVIGNQLYILFRPKLKMMYDLDESVLTSDEIIMRYCP